MTQCVKLFRGRAGEHSGVDVSRKSAGPLGLPFAPPWELVMQSKRGELPWDEYRRQYFERLFWTGDWPVLALHTEGLRQGGSLGLLCYCTPDEPQCHSLLLIEWLTTVYPLHFEVKLR